MKSERHNGHGLAIFGGSRMPESWEEFYEVASRDGGVDARLREWDRDREHTARVLAARGGRKPGLWIELSQATPTRSTTPAIESDELTPEAIAVALSTGNDPSDPEVRRAFIAASPANRATASQRAALPDGQITADQIEVASQLGFDLNVPATRRNWIAAMAGRTKK